MTIHSIIEATVDPGIAPAVRVLLEAGVETFESCQGGNGHCFPDPTVRFHGERPEGFRALAAVLQMGFKVLALRRCWPIVDDEPTGPTWELVFFPGLYVDAERRDQVLRAGRDAGTAQEWFSRAR